VADDQTRRTIRRWLHELEAPDAQLTLDELSALCLLHIRENTLQARQAAEHTEGMVGAVDDLLARWTQQQGIPYAGSTEVRAALDAARDEHRKLAAARRSGS
jgi:hypothetical protein